MSRSCPSTGSWTWRPRRVPALLRLGWGADYNDPMTFLDLFLSSDPFFKTGNYKNERYDQLITQAPRRRPIRPSAWR